MLSPFQFSGVRAAGMYGGPNGTYGTYSLGPNVSRWDMKNDRERQSGE
jgi:hypothetical protein